MIPLDESRMLAWKTEMIGHRSESPMKLFVMMSLFFAGCVLAHDDATESADTSAPRNTVFDGHYVKVGSVHETR